MERWIGAVDLAVRAEGGAQVIEGYAAVFNSLSEDLGGFREQIAPGAFASSIGGDVRALWNHDHGIVLGRTKAGTLTLTEDKRGLRVRITPPQSAAGLVESVARGDVDAMSFGFTVDKDSWQRTDTGPVRTLHAVGLREVSIVAFPAYQATSVDVRALWGELPSVPDSVQPIRRAPVADNVQDTWRAPGGDDNYKGGKMADKLAAVDMRRKANSLFERAQLLDSVANNENRIMTPEERGEYDTSMAERARLEEAATRAEQLATVRAEPAPGTLQMPNVNYNSNQQRNEERAFAAFLRGQHGQQANFNMRASNAVDMVEGTPANGGYAVPVGLYNGIIAKRRNYSLADRLGVRRIPGKGLTVNVPTEAGTVNPFVLTGEKALKDKDTPVLGQIVMTLKKYTKVIPVTTELLDDEDANLMAFIEDYVASAMADTYNTQLINAALAVGGTAPGFSILPLADDVPAPGMIPAMYYGLREPYADNAKWVMRRATEGAFFGLQGENFVYGNAAPGAKDSLWGAPVYNVVDVPGMAAEAKAIIFADWSYMGMRESQSIGFLRDPYSRVLENVVQFVYEFRVAFAVLQPEAGVIGQFAAAG